jgi:predicted DNA-binding transcriptional regulator AlpA
MTLLNRNKAAKFLGLSLSSFDTARKKDGFPAPVIMLNNSRWIQGDLEQYVEDSKEVTK